jgi:hypothetical protein
MANLPKLVVGQTYLFQPPTLPAFYGVVRVIRPDDVEPVHVWIDRTGAGGLADPAVNPALVILGAGWVVSPGTPAPPTP